MPQAVWNGLAKEDSDAASFAPTAKIEDSFEDDGRVLIWLDGVDGGQ
jgi:hypothetical protein